MKIETCEVTEMKPQVSKKTLFTVTSREVFRTVMSGVIDPIADDAEENGSEQRNTELLRTISKILYGSALQIQVEEFFHDGWTMMAVPELTDYLDRNPTISPEDCKLIITHGKGEYTINGRYLKY